MTPAGNRRRGQDPVADEYSRLAPAYDTRWACYIDATVRETIARLPLHPSARLLDVGCGTGALLQALSREYPHALLAGVDPVDEMLAAARERLSPDIVLVRGRAEALPFESGEFDAVVSCSVLHYIRDPLTALQEMGRVLRPGGQLVITDWCADYLTCRLLDGYLRLFNRAHFKVYGEQGLRRLFAAAGHPYVHVDRYKIGWLWGLMTARSARNAPTERPGATAQAPGSRT